MALTETSKREFAKRILNVLVSHADTARTAGVDASVKAAKLNALIDEAFAAEDAQIRIAAESLQATQRSRTTMEAAYAEASAAVELIVGSLGKKDMLSHRLKKLREEMSRTSKDSAMKAADAEKKTA